jgi:hypothetical protein
MTNFLDEMTDHVDAERQSRKSESKDSESGGPGGKLAKTNGLKNKLTAHLHKLDHHDLMALHHSITAELARRAEKHSDAHPGRMSRDQFEKFAAMEIGNAADTAKRKKEHSL